MAVAKPRTLSGGPEVMGGLSARRHRLPALSRVDGWLLGAIGVLALAALSLALRSDATVFLKPFSEDGYYSLAVARSMAAGHGMTIDGVTLTNGIQPLLTVIQAGLFWLAHGNDLLALRLVLILYWLLYLGTGALLGWIAAMALPDPEGRATRALTTALIYLGASYLFLHHFNGLETGLLLFLLAAAWRYQQAGAAESWPGLALFGALLGLAVLARIDASFLVVCLAIAELWRWRRRSLIRGLARAALLGAMALLVSAPWWTYNILVFGSPMPISGTATQSWAIDGFRFGWFLWGLAMGAFPWLFGGEAEGTLLNIIRLPLYAGGLWLLWRVYRRLPAETRDFALALGAAVILLGFYYWLSSIAYWFYSRYLTPAALPVALGLGLAAAELLRAPAPRAGLARPAPSRAGDRAGRARLVGQGHLRHHHVLGSGAAGARIGAGGRDGRRGPVRHAELLPAPCGQYGRQGESRGLRLPRPSLGLSRQARHPLVRRLAELCSAGAGGQPRDPWLEARRPAGQFHALSPRRAVSLRRSQAAIICYARLQSRGVNRWRDCC